MAVGTKISEYPDGGEPQSGDKFVVARSGQNFSIDSDNMAPVVVPSAFVTFEATGSFDKADYSGISFVVVEVISGGGGGGGSGTNARSAGAGGSGAYSKKIIQAATLGASETVTIGAAGTAGASGNNAGGNGGTSSFGTHVSCTGGTGGNAGNGAAGEAAGGVATGGNVNINGFVGGSVEVNGTGPTSGGSTPMGFGQGANSRSRLTAANIAGNAGSGYGAGGGGGFRLDASVAGGAGTAGVCIVTVYIET